MAEESKIFYRVIVHGEEGLATIQKMNGQFVKTKVPVENLNQELDKLNGTLSLTTSQAGRQMSKFKKLRGDVQINSKEYQNLTKSMRMYQKQIDMSTGATGSASSAAMELGRVVSDMPYGIRGVANNLSQFASQMAYSAKSTGSLKLAVKDLFQALTGPLGILLVIQAVISAFDHFAGGAKKAQKEVTDLTSKTYASSLVAKQYVKELEDVNLTEERRKVVTQELIKLVPTLKKEDLKYGENLDKVRLKISSYALAQASRIEIDKLVQENSKELASKNELESIKQIKNDEERISRMKKFILETGEDVSGFVLGFGDKAKIENEDINEIEETFKRLGKVIDKQSNPIMERIAELTKSLKLDPSKNGDGKGKRPKAFTLFTPDSIEKQVKFAKKLIKKVAEAMGVEIGKNPIDLNKLIDVELSDETKALIKKYNEDLKAEMALSDQLGDAQDFISKSQDILGGMTNFMNAQFEREMTIESNKTSALNEELNNRLLNENLSKDERVKIQNQIAINDEKLRKKQEKIAKKQFDMNKASNIASALMDTSAAAIGVMKDAKGGFFARLSQALPTIAFGLAQVAAISRQKFQSSSAATPINTTGGGGGAGATERADPSFNIVGRSGDNLLINAIQAQFDKPLKAYVVSRDVTNQQQLDGMIVSQAGT
jgi:hypothetical protein